MDQFAILHSHQQHAESRRLRASRAPGPDDARYTGGARRRPPRRTHSRASLVRTRAGRAHAHMGWGERGRQAGGDRRHRLIVAWAMGLAYARNREGRVVKRCSGSSQASQSRRGPGASQRLVTCASHTWSGRVGAGGGQSPGWRWVAVGCSARGMERGRRHAPRRCLSASMRLCSVRRLRRRPRGGRRRRRLGVHVASTWRRQRGNFSLERELNRAPCGQFPCDIGSGAHAWSRGATGRRGEAGGG